MIPTTFPCPEFHLELADGTRLDLSAADETAAAALAFLAQTARLAPRAPQSEAAPTHLRMVTAAPDGSLAPQALQPGQRVCILEAPEAQRRPQLLGRRAAPPPDPTPEQKFWQRLTRLSSAIARTTHPRGGFLVHSAMALSPGGSGILLAGRSGVGKSTASRRLCPPWRSLSDDVTLIVRDAHGTYWAHPWPTWSRFFGEERGDGSDTWEMQQAVPLRAIFVLEQAGHDLAEPLGSGHAAALLTELARQTSTYYLRGMPLDEIGAFNRQRFENICTLAKTLPAYQLNVCLGGRFWTEIEKVLNKQPLCAPCE